MEETMKCVVKKDGKGIRRVSDKLAESLVKSENYQYASKKEWKEAGRPIKDNS